MFTFEVIAGSADVGHDRLYNRGDRFQHPSRLDRKFRNKFRLVSTDEDLDESPEVVEKTPHVDPPVTSPSTPPPTVPETPDVTETTSEDEEKEEVERKDPSQYGKDVTDKFDSAAGADLLVFQRGSRFFIQDPDDLGIELNEKGLMKKDVDGFISEYQGE